MVLNLLVAFKLTFISVCNSSELAIIANRKNTDEHIVLLGWSVGNEGSDVAVVDIDRDKWLPRIELQGA